MALLHGRAAARWCWRSSARSRCCWRSGRRSTRCCSTACRASTSFTRRSAGSTRSRCASRCWRVGCCKRAACPDAGGVLPPQPPRRGRGGDEAVRGCSPSHRAPERMAAASARSRAAPRWVAASGCVTVGAAGDRSGLFCRLASRCPGARLVADAGGAGDAALAGAAATASGRRRCCSRTSGPIWPGRRCCWRPRAAALAAARRRLPLAGPLAVALLVVDLFSFGIGVQHRRGHPRRWISCPSPSPRSRPIPDLFRIVTYGEDDTLPSNTNMLFGLQDVRGYDTIILREYVDYLEQIEPQRGIPYSKVAKLFDQQLAVIAAARPAERQVRADLEDAQPARLEPVRAGRRHPRLPQRQRHAARLRAERAASVDSHERRARRDPCPGLRSPSTGRHRRHVGHVWASADRAGTLGDAPAGRGRRATATTGSPCGRRRARRRRAGPRRRLLPRLDRHRRRRPDHGPAG